MRIFFASILALIVLMGCVNVPSLGNNELTDDQRKTLASVKLVSPEYPFYEMRYVGDYETLRGNVHKALGLVGSTACTTVSYITGDNTAILCRNNDDVPAPVLVLFTNPSDGYASVSMVNMGFLGFSIDAKGMTEKEKTKLLYAPYLPFDGMNEYGLCVGNMALKDGIKPELAPGKVTLFSLELLREILDHAKNTDEALGILERYNIYFPQLPQHFLISDRSGHSVIIEYGKKNINVIESGTPYQICANAPVLDSGAILAGYREKFRTGSHFKNDVYGNSYYRLLTAEDDLIRNMGSLSAETGMLLLKDVSFDNNSRDVKYPTLWSVVYQSTGAVSVAINGDYGNIFSYAQNMKK